MTSLTDLREVVDVVIGVDTHVHTHSAAAIDAATGGVLGEITVDATGEGYAQLVEFAGEHATLRAWAIEGTGGHGAGLSRHLGDREEIVVELDRPKRAKRRNGAKSDPLDAVRAAREALARTRLGTPRSGGERQALSRTDALEPSNQLPVRLQQNPAWRTYLRQRQGAVDKARRDMVMSPHKDLGADVEPAYVPVSQGPRPPKHQPPTQGPNTTRPPSR